MSKCHIVENHMNWLNIMECILSNGLHFEMTCFINVLLQMNGHVCLVSEEEPGDLEPISPEDLIRMLNL